MFKVKDQRLKQKIKTHKKDNPPMKSLLTTLKNK